MTELGKLGAKVEEGRDYCIVTPPKAVKPGVAIDTYDDHRMVSFGSRLSNEHDKKIGLVITTAAM